MQRFGKIYPSTYTGSMYGSGAIVFAVWSYVLANAWDGLVEINPPLVASVIGCDVSDVERALEKLCGPDYASRNPDEEGRRLIHQEAFTYRLTSWDKYHTMATTALQRERNTASQARSRERKRNALQATPPASNGAMPAQKEAPVALDAEKAEVAALVAAEPPRIRVPLELWQKYRSQNRLKPYKPLGMKGLIKRLRGFADPQDAVEFSISMNYQGVFERGGEQEKRLTMAERHERDMGEIKERMGL